MSYNKTAKNRKAGLKGILEEKSVSFEWTGPDGICSATLAADSLFESFSHCLKCLHGDLEIYILMQRAFMENITSKIVPVHEIPALPQDLKIATLETLLGPMLGSIHRSLGLALNIMDIYNFTQNSNINCRIPFKVECGGEKSSVHIAFSDETFERLLPIIDALPSKAKAYFPGSQVILNFVMGRTRLSAGELAGLEAGDVIFIAHDYQKHGNMKVMLDDKCLFTGVMESDKLIIKAISEDGTLSETAPSAWDEAASDELPYELCFEFQGKSMVFSDVESLRAGSVMDLPEGPDLPVEIKSGGRILGIGRLVRIDGRLGLECTCLLASVKDLANE
ncbi:MAG: FliM/FliN family flagellar motor switch protein [Oligoflexales bacterium]|nr:FliM/FliN family flagellar motor switch protein [Oligoflexales bacterium]